jgi:hypothetical protein
VPEQELVKTEDCHFGLVSTQDMAQFAEGYAHQVYEVWVKHKDWGRELDTGKALDLIVLQWFKGMPIIPKSIELCVH